MWKPIKMMTILYLLSRLLNACQSPPQLTPEQRQAYVQTYTQKVERYLKKSDDVDRFVSITDSGIMMRIPAFDNLPQQIEFNLKWEDVEDFKKLAQYYPHQALEVYQGQLKLSETKTLPPDTLTRTWSEKHPLAGLKIALDPGHIGGDMETAKLEGKFVEMTKEPVAIYESELNWYTAKALKNKLTALGAQVLITREAHYLTALDMTYDEWYAQLDSLPKPRKQVAFFRFFKNLDNTARIQKINAFEPDLTLIIHYNVDSKNPKWQKTTKRNNSMAFVGGSFMRNELYDTERRFNFLRLLLNDDIEYSIDLAGSMLEHLHIRLGIPPIPPVNEQRYLESVCIPTKFTGVYARNLALSSRVYGPVCYMEPLYQDNEYEAQAFAKRDYEFEGRKISSRIIEIADTYLNGVLAFVEENGL